jgi:DNA-binding response OmpR family regulator
MVTPAPAAPLDVRARFGAAPHGPEDGPGVLGPQERAVLTVLVESAGRVVSRRELARRIGVADRHERRCDSLLVSLRRVVGSDVIVTVRGRGWMVTRDAAGGLAALLE